MSLALGSLALRGLPHLGLLEPSPSILQPLVEVGRPPHAGVGNRNGDGGQRRVLRQDRVEFGAGDADVGRGGRCSQSSDWRLGAREGSLYGLLDERSQDLFEVGELEELDVGQYCHAGNR